MADFVAVLKKTLEGLSDTTPAMREKVYEKARITIAGKLAAMNPPLPEGVVVKQKQALEEAIVQVEKEYRKPADPLSELESVFASLKNPDPKIVLRDTAAKPPAAERAQPAPAAPKPASAPAAVPAAAKTVAPSPAAPKSQAAPPAPAKSSTPQAKAEPASPAVKAASPAAKAVVIPPPPSPDESAPADAFVEDEVVEDDGGPPFLPGRDDGETIVGDEEPERRRGYGRLIAAGVVLAILAGGGYAAWANRDKVEQMLAGLGLPGLGQSPGAPEATPAAEPAPDVAAVQPPAEPEPAQPAPEAAAPEPPVEEGPQKFTQRLNADGTETDAGPANAPAAIGEGTSIAAVTQPSMPSAEPAAPAPADQPPAATPGTPTENPAETAQAPGEPPPADAPQAPAAAGETPAAPADAPATGPTDTPGQPPETAAAPTDAPAQPTPPEAAAAQPPATETPPATPTTPEPGTPPATAETPAAEPAAPAQPAQTAQGEPGVAVGQRAIFYEERTNVADASAEPGSIVWSMVQESPGGDLPPEPAIRAEATIPGKDVQLRMTIRRNADQTLPASHIIEMIFLTPQGFEGGGIDNVLRVSLKGSEQEAGSPLLGIPAKIADGFFLIALNDTKPEVEANTRLLRAQSWIDVPIQYKSGRRALFTMEKGIPGTKVFDEALKAWQAASSG
ncbi:hypothetical protein RB623_23500 [Mesorhizobium sp. LHD-90]|uniref:hypothetical protein n=1 Tax=Mesorhizobium sp. LHD-90 TaxID=3071414 RepID=UPI0027E194FD|nr:hypothetical protein [Mesorhizobium sp. LHD-90]MDQ6437028.1 hypothetical protein [Mesorhizobium sp. LHD-90]